MKNSHRLGLAIFLICIATGIASAQSIRAQSVNLAPAPAFLGGSATVRAETYYCTPGITLSVSNPNRGVLANDQNAFGATLLSANLLDGTVTLRPDGTFTYMPASRASKVCGGSFHYYVNHNSTARATANIVQCASDNGCSGDAPTAPSPAPAAQNQAVSDSKQRLEGIPIITGGIALNNTFEPGETEMNPVVAPVFLVPLGRRVLFESEVEIETDIVFAHGERVPTILEKQVEYAQFDFFVNKYLTIIAGRYPTPFNIYKERFDAKWIRNLAKKPMIFKLADSSGNGGQLRGAVPLGSSAQFSYAAYFSAQTTNNVLVPSDRETGFRTAVFFPGERVEVGFSFNRLLGEERFNKFGTDFAWNMRRLPLDIRGEALFSKVVGNGYWVEGAYRFSGSRFPGWLRRSQAVARFEQYFTPSAGIPEGFDAPEINTSRAFFGWNYWLTDSIRAQVAYGRKFATDDNHNIWTVGISYRFIK